ncbi:MAG TPA: hypothetical protein VFQ61_05995 [Polyangiaceae bacterium]|nr:hypothetical protein [Polyangiaceae bacterium]
MRFLAIVFGICGLVSFAEAAGAATPERAPASQKVALVRPESPSGASDTLLLDACNRLRAELELQHFETEVVSAPLGEHTADSLTEIARKVGAIAGIALVHREPLSSTAVEIWLVDRISGKTTLRRIELGRTPDASSVLAIRAVDLLRASFEEFQSVGEPPPEVAEVDRRPPPPAVRQFATSELRSYAVAIQGVGLLNGPTLGASYGPALGVARCFADFELWLLAAGPLVGADFEASQGGASSRQEMAWLEARGWLMGTRDFHAGLGAGLGGHFLQAEGQAEPPLRSRSDSTWGFVGLISAHAQLQLSSRLALGFSLRALALMPRQGIAVLDERVKLQQPLLSSTAGVVIGL